MFLLLIYRNDSFSLNHPCIVLQKTLENNNAHSSQIKPIILATQSTQKMTNNTKPTTQTPICYLGYAFSDKNKMQRVGVYLVRFIVIIHTPISSITT